MISETVYSAGLMSQSFWFLEFKKAARLRNEGLSYDEIKKKCVEENLFGAAKEYSALRMAGYIITRIKVMDDTLVELFCSADLATQKLINLIKYSGQTGCFLSLYTRCIEKKLFSVWSVWKMHM